MAEILGDGGLDAQVVALALAGNADAFADPEGAAVDGVVPCGEGPCWALLVSRDGATVESELWVDRETVRNLSGQILPRCLDSQPKALYSGSSLLTDRLKEERSVARRR